MRWMRTARGRGGGGRQVRFEVALGGWVATGGVGRATGVGKRERQPERDSPTPVRCKRGEVAARVRVKRIFACVHPSPLYGVSRFNV